jgi:hypothetical protein
MSYYLCYCKYNEIKSPAEYLNEILIDIKGNIPSNKPNFVRAKRGLREVESSTDESEVNSDDEKVLSSLKEKQIIDPKTNTQIKSKKFNSTENQNSSDVLNPLENNTGPNPDLIINSFQAHIPKWGGIINYQGRKNVTLVNTCTIDYFLFSFWVLEKLVPNFSNNLPNLEPTPILKEIIQNIDIFNWNMAKEIWISRIMKYNKKPNKTLSMFGSERDRFLNYLKYYQLHNLYQVCNTNCNRNGFEIQGESNEIYFIRNNNTVILDHGYTGRCVSCGEFISCDLRFLHNPNFLFIDSLNNNIFVNELPKEITLDNKKYRFLCSSIGFDSHFLCIFELENQFFVVNDIGQTCTFLPLFNENIFRKKTYLLS